MNKQNKHEQFDTFKKKYVALESLFFCPFFIHKRWIFWDFQGWKHPEEETLVNNKNMQKQRTRNNPIRNMFLFFGSGLLFCGGPIFPSSQEVWLDVYRILQYSGVESFAYIWCPVKINKYYTLFY